MPHGVIGALGRAGDGEETENLPGLPGPFVVTSELSTRVRPKSASPRRPAQQHRQPEKEYSAADPCYSSDISVSGDSAV